jgi:phage terminase large subunit-like protein
MSDALDFLAALVLEHGRRWGDAAYDFQWADARAVLDESSSVPYNFLTRPRGGSKTTDLAGITLAAMATQLGSGSRLYALAADRDQGRLLVDAIRGFCHRTPGLEVLFQVDSYRVSLPRDDIVLEVMAADAPGAWGLRPALLIVDELAQWPDTNGARRLWDATSSAMAKRSDSRMVVLTTAGDPAHWSYQIREQAKTSSLWRLHEVPDPHPWQDPARLQEQRDRFPDSLFRRLFLNEWVDAEDRVTNAEEIRRCVKHRGALSPRPRVDYVIGVDTGVVDDRTAVAVCHLEPTRDEADIITETVVLDELKVWHGTKGRPVDLSAVEQWIFETVHAFNRAHVVMDPWQMMGVKQRLENHRIGVTVFDFSEASKGHLAATLLTSLRDRRLHLTDDSDLLDELIQLQIRETKPNVLRIDHDPGRHDDRVIALLLAAQHLLSRPRPRKARLVPDHPLDGGQILWQQDSYRSAFSRW